MLRLQRGGVAATEGVVRFDPDLDRGLQRCEDVLLADAADGTEPAGMSEVLAGMPPQLRAHLERVSVAGGTPVAPTG